MTKTLKQATEHDITQNHVSRVPSYRSCQVSLILTVQTDNTMVTKHDPSNPIGKYLNKASSCNSDDTVNDSDSRTSSRNQSALKGTLTEYYTRWYERKNQCRFKAYCTQSCLRGLLTGGLLDETCPNVETHRKHDNYHCLNPSTIRELMRRQLSKSLVTDCYALDKKSSRGALFKVRLTSHGYTVAAKCTIWASNICTRRKCISN